MVRDYVPYTLKPKKTTAKQSNEHRHAFLAQDRRVAKDLAAADAFAALCERYPHPGPATMAKLEALYLRMTGEKAPHLVTDSV